jgi:hypothetical protein
MKRSIAVAVAIAALAVPAGALASGNGTPPSYTELQGNVPSNAQCGTGAGSGAFGAFGDKNDFGTHDFGGGADGYQTGLNNSSLCGNRQP